MIKHVATILSGTVLAQLIALVMMPIISRLYSPEAFGAFQMLFSVASTLLPLVALRMEFAILRVKAQVSVVVIVQLCLIINAVVAVLVFLTVRFAVPIIAPNQQGHLWVGWLLPIAILAMGFLQTLNYLPLRDARYGIISISKIVQSGSFSVGGAAIGAIATAAHPAGLVIVDTIGRIASGLIVGMNWLLRNHVPVSRLFRLDWRQMKSLLNTYRQYPIFSVPSGLISAISLSLPVFWLSAFQSTEAVGQFGMVWRVGAMPLMMISFAVSQIVNARFSAGMRNNVNVPSSFILKISLGMVAIGILPSAVIFLAGEPILTFVLGKQWYEAGQMFEYMTPLFLNILAMGPINMVLVITGRPGIHLIWEILNVTILLVSLATLQLTSPSALTTVAVYSVVTLLMGIVYVSLAFRFARLTARG